jgi:ABC-2 type transport system permease protein
MSPTAPRSAFSPILAAALIEFRKMFALRRILVLLLLVVVAAAVALVSQALGATPSGDDPRAPAWSDVYVATAFLRAVVPLICLYVGASLWSEELESGTLVYIVTRPVSRPAVLLAKYAAAWVFLSAALWMAMLGTGGTLCVMRDHGFAGLFATLVILPMSTGVWLALFLLVGTTMRRSLIGGIVLGGVLELLVASLPTIARLVAPGHHIGSAVLAFGAFSDVSTNELVTGDPVSGWVAWTVLILITAGSLTLACLPVRYKEYAPTRTD